MKGKKLFGIPLAVLLIGLMVVGGATAALVGYLSNTAEMDATVQSPLDIKFVEIAEDDEWVDAITGINNVAAYTSSWSDSISLTETGLSTAYVGVKLTNNADVKIEDKILKVTVSNENGDVTCNDLTSLTFIDVGCSEGTSCYQVVQELVGIGLCAENERVITYNIPINSLDSEQVYKYPVTLTFANVEPQQYYFDAQLVN